MVAAMFHTPNAVSNVSFSPPQKSYLVIYVIYVIYQKLCLI